MRFILCMLLMSVGGLSMAYITADAEQLQNSSFLPADFDVGDLELDTKTEVSNLIFEAKQPHPKVRESLQGHYTNQTKGADTSSKAKEINTKLTSSSYGLCYRHRTETLDKILQPPSTPVLIYSDLPIEVGWYA